MPIINGEEWTIEEWNKRAEKIRQEREDNENRRTEYLEELKAKYPGTMLEEMDKLSETMEKLIKLRDSEIFLIGKWEEVTLKSEKRIESLEKIQKEQQERIDMNFNYIGNKPILYEFQIKNLQEGFALLHDISKNHTRLDNLLNEKLEIFKTHLKETERRIKINSKYLGDILK